MGGWGSSIPLVPSPSGAEGGPHNLELSKAWLENTKSSLSSVWIEYQAKAKLELGLTLDSACRLDSN